MSSIASSSGKSISDIKELFLKHIRDKKIEIRGVENGGNGNMEVVPRDFLLRDDISFDLEGNELGVPEKPFPSTNGLSLIDGREKILHYFHQPLLPGWKNLK